MNFTAMSRRSLLRGAGATLSLGAVVRNGVAAEADALSIAYPVDVPTWDPNARLLIPAQPIYKCVATRH